MRLHLKLKHLQLHLKLKHLQLHLKLKHLQLHLKAHVMARAHQYQPAHMRVTA